MEPILYGRIPCLCLDERRMRMDGWDRRSGEGTKEEVKKTVVGM